MSRQGPRRPVPREIQALRRRVKRWRNTRAKRSPMPEALWQEATRLAAVHGVSAVSRHASVGYASLQKRAEAACQESTSTSEPTEASDAGFVELSAAQLLGASSERQTVVELSDQHGMRMTLRLAPDQQLDVLRLVQGIWEGGR